MKKIILLFVFLGFLISHGFSQNHAIEGTVVNPKNIPLTGVNISIAGTSNGTQTDAKGRFNLSTQLHQRVEIQFSYIGYKAIRRTIILNQSEIQLGNIVLQRDNRKIEEVVISNQQKNKFADRESEYVAKLPLKNLENPQVYTTVSAELLQEQGVTNFDDALKNVPGMQKLWESTGRGSDGAGYYSLRGFAVQPKLENGLPALTNGSPDPANVERIEVMRGPSGTLYGSSLVSYGGLINVVTQKPYRNFGGEIDYLSGSFGLNRLTADINTPLDSTNQALLRINSAYHSENSFQDAGFKKSLFFAPSFSYKASDRLSFLVVSEFMTQEQTNPTMLFLYRGAPLTFDNIHDLPYDPDRSYTSNDLSIKNPTMNMQAQALYKLSPSWSSQTAFSKSHSESKGYYTYLYENQAYAAQLPKGIIFTRYLSDQNTATNVTDIQQNFTGDFKIESFRNRLVLGLDFMQRNYIDNSTSYIANGTVYMGNDDPETVDATLYDGATVSNYDNGVLSRQATDALLESASVDNSKTKEITYSAYASDVINFTPAVAVMASLRVDRFVGDPDDDDDNQTALSPKFGITYQPVLNKLTLFGNYMNGFSNVAAQQVSDVDGSNVHTKRFDPEHANQYEFGVKSSLWKDRLATTVSYYHINVGNKVMTDPDNLHNSVQNGEVESKGIELSLAAHPLQGLNATFGFSHNHSEILKGDANIGQRDLNSGPATQMNFWASYEFGKSSALKGLGAGFGFNYQGELYIINYDATGDFKLPSYTIANAGLFYAPNRFRIALNVDNLTDKEYYTGWSTINPQKPRSYTLSFAFKF